MNVNRVYGITPPIKTGDNDLLPSESISVFSFQIWILISWLCFLIRDQRNQYQLQ